MFFLAIGGSKDLVDLNYDGSQGCAVMMLRRSTEYCKVPGPLCGMLCVSDPTVKGETQAGSLRSWALSR